MSSAASETATSSRAGARRRGSVRGALGVVFCGGASSRMGRDKAALAFEGRRLIDRAVDTLAELAPRVVLASGPRPRFPELGLECVLDAGPDLGPLAGLAAALEHAERHGEVDVLCVLACDMPRATADAYRTLLERLRADAADVALVATTGGVEPLLGVYRARVLPAVRAALARGARRMDAFHPDVRVTTVPAEALPPGCARNLNTPDDLAAEEGAT